MNKKIIHMYKNIVLAYIIRYVLIFFFQISPVTMQQN